MATAADKIKVATHYLVSSPPGQVADVEKGEHGSELLGWDRGTIRQRDAGRTPRARRRTVPRSRPLRSKTHRGPTASRDPSLAHLSAFSRAPLIQSPASAGPRATTHSEAQMLCRFPFLGKHPAPRSFPAALLN